MQSQSPESLSLCVIAIPRVTVTRFLTHSLTHLLLRRLLLRHRRRRAHIPRRPIGAVRRHGARRVSVRAHARPRHGEFAQPRLGGRVQRRLRRCAAGREGGRVGREGGREGGHSGTIRNETERIIKSDQATTQWLQAAHKHKSVRLKKYSHIQDKKWRKNTQRLTRALGNMI